MSRIISILPFLALLAACSSDASVDELATRGAELLDMEHHEAFSRYVVAIEDAERTIFRYHGHDAPTLVVDPDVRHAVLAIDDEQGTKHVDALADDGAAIEIDEISLRALELSEDGLLPEPNEFRLRRRNDCEVMDGMCNGQCAATATIMSGSPGPDGSLSEEAHAFLSACTTGCTYSYLACY